jgi:hypothetical protein
MRDLVVIEDSTILSMINDVQYSSTIPCLANKKDVFRTSAGGCGTCARKRQEKQRYEMARIKSCLAGLSTEKKAELKRLLDTDKVRVVFVNGGGKVVQLTF